MKIRFLLATLATLSLAIIAAVPHNRDTDSNPETSATTQAVASPPTKPRLGKKKEPKPPTDFELPREIQEEIWDAEHITFEIERRLGARIKRAIQTKQQSIFHDCLTPTFKGSVATDKTEKREHANITEQLWRAESGTGLSPKNFATGFLRAFDDITKVHSSSCRVLGIDRTNTGWKTSLLVTASGTSGEHKLVDIETTSEVNLSFTKDADLDHENVIENWHEKKRAHRKGISNLFQEVTEEWGLNNTPLEDNWKLPKEQVLQYRFQVAVEDVNQDGWLDIALATKHNSYLYAWNPDTKQFEEKGRSMGIPVRHTPLVPPQGKRLATEISTNLAGFIDFNNDGFPDLVLGNRLYENQQGIRLKDITLQSGIAWNPQSMGIHVADYDLDGRLDLYILEQGTHKIQSGTPLGWINDDDHGSANRLWRNLGDGVFTEVTRRANASGGKGHTLAATWLHYNDDTFPDLYIANDFSRNVLLENQGNGKFRDVSKRSGASDFATSMGVAAGDLDGDGYEDLYVANMYSKMGRRIIRGVTQEDYPAGIYDQIKGSCAGNRLYFGSSDSRYEEEGEHLEVHDVGWAYAPALADFDNDGRLDMYATAGFLSFTRQKPDG